MEVTPSFAEFETSRAKSQQEGYWRAIAAVVAASNLKQIDAAMEEISKFARAVNKPPEDVDLDIVRLREFRGDADAAIEREHSKKFAEVAEIDARIRKLGQDLDKASEALAKANEARGVAASEMNSINERRNRRQHLRSRLRDAHCPDALLQ